MYMGTQKGPSSMYRYRSVGTQRYGDLSGSVTLGNEELMGSAWSWGSVWSANSGSMAIYKY